MLLVKIQKIATHFILDITQSPYKGLYGYR